MSQSPEAKRVILPISELSPVSDDQLIDLIGVSWRHLGKLAKAATPRKDQASAQVMLDYYYFDSILKRRNETQPISGEVDRFVHHYKSHEYVFHEPIDIAPLFNGLGRSVVAAEDRVKDWQSQFGEEEVLVSALQKEAQRLETLRRVIYIYSEPPSYRESGSQREARLDYEERNQARIARQLAPISHDPFEIIANNRTRAESRLREMRWLKLPSKFTH